MVYSETHIDVFNCATGEWVQTLNIKRAKPLNDSGSLTLCVLHELPHLLYLSNVHQSNLPFFLIFLFGFHVVVYRRIAQFGEFCHRRYGRESGAETAQEVFAEGRKQVDQIVSTILCHCLSFSKLF